jgi:hypothetical protein
LIPNPIRKVLSSIQKHRVRALLMGGQACVFYGAAEFSRDTDLAILADTANLSRRRAALAELQAEVIAVPPLHLGWSWHGGTQPLYRRLTPKRPLLSCTRLGDSSGLERGLRNEEDHERQADRLCWLPLRRELEALRHRSQGGRDGRKADRFSDFLHTTRH